MIYFRPSFEIVHVTVVAPITLLQFINNNFTVNTKFSEIVIFAWKDFTAAKMLPPVGLKMLITGSRHYCWLKSLTFNQLS